MRKAMSLSLVLALSGQPGLSQAPSPEPSPTLELGIQQVNAGDFQVAILTLDTVTRDLANDPATHAKELSQAYLYRGVAFVGLAQEEKAKGSFAAALQYDKTLRLSEDKFSPRVVRVFEAARTGKTKSVLLPPSNVAKKAGIGTLGIVGIVAGALALAGGAAAAAGGGVTQAPTPAPVPTPVPTPTPTPTPTANLPYNPGNTAAVQVMVSGCVVSMDATVTLVSNDYIINSVRFYLKSDSGDIRAVIVRPSSRSQRDFHAQLVAMAGPFFEVHFIVYFDNSDSPLEACGNFCYRSTC